ncbi:MAG: hypothetical protein P8H61_10545 [Ilumatobacter sp.]|nr:hypothetical protein [Ilumatobacter sp.]
MATNAELQHLAANTLSPDPRTALSACRRLSTEELPWLTERAVHRARRQGWSWRIIGQLLGVSGQAARKRFIHLDRPAMPSLDRRPERWAETEHRSLAAHARQLRLAADLAAWERSGVDIVPW